MSLVMDRYTNGGSCPNNGGSCPNNGCSCPNNGGSCPNSVADAVFRNNCSKNYGGTDIFTFPNNGGTDIFTFPNNDGTDIFTFPNNCGTDIFTFPNNCGTDSSTNGVPTELDAIWRDYFYITYRIIFSSRRLRRKWCPISANYFWFTHSIRIYELRKYWWSNIRRNMGYVHNTRY